MDVEIALPLSSSPISKPSGKMWSVSETRHWCIMLFVGTTLLYASRVALPMSITLVSADYKWSKTDSGVVLSCFFWGYAIVQGIAGYLADIYGGEIILAGAALMWSLLTFLTPILFNFAAETPFAMPIIICVRVVLGICQGFHFPTVASLVGRNLVSVEKARVFGMILAASHVGTVICGSFGSVILDKFGWEVLFYVIGTLGIVWCGYLCHICLWSTSRRFVREKSPEDVKLKILFGDQFDDESSHQSPIRRRSQNFSSSPVPWCELFKKVPFWAACCAHFCGANAYFTLFSWLPSFFVENFPEAQGWVFNVVPNFAIMITSLVAPYIAANLITKGYTPTVVRKIMEGVSQVGIAICLFQVSSVYGYVSALFFLSAAMALRGFHHGGVCVNPQDFAPNHTGAVFGLMNMASAIPGFIGVYAAGYILETYQSWSYVFYTTGFTCLIGVCVYTTFGTGKQII